MDNSYTLELFLKANSTSRLSIGNRWLVWNEDLWEIYEQPYRRKVSRTLATNSLGKALQALEADNGQS